MTLGAGLRSLRGIVERVPLEPGPRGRRLLAALALGVVALAVAAVWALSAAPFDDAYIHLRIARHLAERGEPYYNAGERVMGGSSPLWLVLLAGGVRLLGPGPGAWLPALEAAILVGVLLAAARFLRVTSGASRPVAFAAALPVVALALPSAGGLMETPLALLLVVLAAIAIALDRPGWAGLATALAVTARFELGVAAVAGLVLLPGWRARARYVLAALPVAVLEIGLLQHAYGTFLPNTAAAKAIVYQLDWAEFLPQLWEKPRWMTMASWGAAALAAATAVLLALTAPSPRPSRPMGERESAADVSRARAFLAATTLVLLAAFVVRRAFVFHWYWTHALGPGGLAALSLALAARGTAAWRRALAVLALGLWLLGSWKLLRNGVADGALALRGRIARSNRVAQSLRTLSLARVGRVLAERCPGAVLMAPEIGAVGHAFPGKILDAVGLVSPELLRFHPMKVPEERPNHFVGAVPAAAVAELRPDAIVGMEIFLRDFLSKRERDPVLAAYRILRWPVVDAAAPAGMPKQVFESSSVVVAVRGGCDPGPPPAPGATAGIVAPRPSP